VLLVVKNTKMGKFDKLQAIYGMMMLPLFPLSYLIDKCLQRYTLKHSWDMYWLNIEILWNG